MQILKILILLTSIIVIITAVIAIGRMLLLKRARSHNYDSLFEYLQAVPSTDPQKLDAVDLALKGGVIIILGVLFPPLIFVGLFPLYYGIRKIMLSLMGLGLTDHPIG
jgi:hypothetical protein